MPTPTTRWATLADRNQRLPEALDLITQALELAPNDPFILDSMGWVKFRMGDQAAAAEYLRRAYSTRPEADIAAHLAEVLWSQGKRDQAVELLRGAKLRTRPTAPCSTRSSGWGRALTTAVMLRWRDASAWLRGALMAMLAFTLAACTTTPKPIEGIGPDAFRASGASPSRSTRKAASRMPCRAVSPGPTTVAATCWT